MDQIVLEPEAKLLDVGAGAKKFMCLKLESEPEFWVSDPQMRIIGLLGMLDKIVLVLDKFNARLLFCN